MSDNNQYMSQTKLQHSAHINLKTVEFYLSYLLKCLHSKRSSKIVAMDVLFQQLCLSKDFIPLITRIITSYNQISTLCLLFT